MSTPTSVYRYYDADGALVYVGITARGIQRQNEHNAHAEWWPFVVRQDVEHYPDRDEAAARERELIQRFRPPFNKQHNDGCERLRDAYLSAHHVTVRGATCATDVECDTGPRETCVAFGKPGTDDGWCGTPGCASCHRAWHRYCEGYSAGWDQGEARFAEAISWLCASDDEPVAQAAYAVRSALARLMNMTSHHQYHQHDSRGLIGFLATDEQIQETHSVIRSFDEYRAAKEAEILTNRQPGVEN